MGQNRAERILARLREGLNPRLLEVLDESAAHEGHAGARPGGETHYRVRISASALDGVSRVAAHRTVNGLLSDEFDQGLHALAIEVVRDPA